MTVLGLIVTGLIENDNLTAGDPRRLINPIDYNGRICGVGTGVGDKPNGYYMLDGSGTNYFCPSRSCNNPTYFSFFIFKSLLVVCVTECPKEANYYAFVCRYELQSDADASLVDAYNYVPARQCMYKISTRKFINRCLPNEDVFQAFQDAQDAASSVNVTLPSYAQYGTSQNANASWFNDFLGDLYNLRAYIFGFGLAVALGMSFVYLHLLRLPLLLFAIIWATILGLLAIFVAATVLLWNLADNWSKDGIHSDPEVETIRIFSYIGIGVSVLYTCVILVMRERIQLAIGVVKESARAMDSMKLIVLVPVLQAAGLVIFMVFWVIYCFFLASSGDVVIHTASYEYNSVEYAYSYRTFTYQPSIRYAFLFMLFAMFWTSEFLVAIGQLVIALSFSAWYFTKVKSSIGSGTVLWVSTKSFHFISL